MTSIINEILKLFINCHQKYWQRKKKDKILAINIRALSSAALMNYVVILSTGSAFETRSQNWSEIKCRERIGPGAVALNFYG